MWRLFLGFVVACGSGSQPPGQGSGSPTAGTGSVSTPVVTAASPNAFFQTVSTYIVGTTGDDISDRVIANQAELIRSTFRPAAKTLRDIDVGAAWPANPVVYGGAHVNAAIAAIAKDLPFEITANKLTIGGRTFEGDGFALLTLVPARAGKYPQFMLYAGTGTPGVAEINAGFAKSNAPIIIVDAFGPLITGTWSIGPDGIATAQLGTPQRRVAWRESTREIAGAKVTFKLYEPLADRDAPMIDKAAAGIATAFAKLAPARTDRPVAFTVVIHPDKRSKATLTGNSFDGHAVGFANTLHVFAYDGLAYLVTHEATHSILLLNWPPAGSSLLGEGIAVWTTGGYNGTTLGSFKGKVTPRPIKELLDSKVFRSLPEAETYPIGGTLLDVAIAKVGLVKVRDHLYSATAATWDDACKAAGTTAAELDAAVAAAL